MDGSMEKRIDALNSAEVLSTSYKNLVNVGPLTPEFTVMVWPFMRQMREIAFDNGWQEPLNVFAPNSHGTGRRIWSFARTS